MYDGAPDFEALRPYLAADEPDEDGEWALHCPLHDDSNASASVNFERGVWNCFAGCPGGEVGELVWRLNQLEQTEITSEGATGGFTASVTDINAARRRKRNSNSIPLPTMGAVNGWHQYLLDHQDLLDYLEARRGITRDTVVRFMIGYDSEPRNEAFTIPMFNADGNLVNVKWYRPDPGEKNKMWGCTKHNEARLYPMAAMKGAKEIYVCEGEMDALILNQYGFPAVTGTGGSEVSVKREWAPFFEGLTVYLVYDRDKAGEKGAAKAMARLKNHAKKILKVALPYEVTEKGGKDVTDFHREHGEDFAQAFKELVTEARDSSKPKGEEESGSAVPITVLDSFNAELAGRPLEMFATIAGKTNSTFQVPREARYVCGMDAGETKCAGCPMAEEFMGEFETEFDPSDPLILEMVNHTKQQIHEIVRGRAAAHKCSKAETVVDRYQAVEELFARPSIDHMEDEKEGDYTNRKVYSVGRHDTMPNRTVRMVGTLQPDPKTQRSEFQAWLVEQTESSIDKFTIDRETKRALEIFQPAPGQGPLAKLHEIALDLSGNVTHIWGRPMLHAAMDLVWHSALSFYFDGVRIDKGWMELLVVGDTRTGKSEVSHKMARHYRAGRVISCESATFAGIVGGLQQYGGKEWSITWGAIPLNDRRLCVLDEVSGLSYEQIGQMSSIRSSGVAELTKIQTEQTRARTRLIWIGNPRGEAMSQFVHGVDALRPLIGNPEDVARFDLAMAAFTDDVNSADINSLNRQAPKHVYTQELCSTLVMWAWSRKAEDIQWERGAEKEVLRKAEALASRYVEQPPLVQGANVRMKIARVAVALAIRTFSTDSTGQRVIVTKKHVRSAFKFIDKMYSKEKFGYRAISRERMDAHRKATRSRDDVARWIRTHEGLEQFLRERNTFRAQDMEQMLGKDRHETGTMLNALWNWNMIRKVGADIVSEPALISLIRDMAGGKA